MGVGICHAFLGCAWVADPIQLLPSVGVLSGRHALAHFPPNPKQTHKHLDPICVAATQVSSKHSDWFLKKDTLDHLIQLLCTFLPSPLDLKNGHISVDS